MRQIFVKPLPGMSLWDMGGHGAVGWYTQRVKILSANGSRKQLSHFIGLHAAFKTDLLARSCWHCPSNSNTDV